MADWFDRLDDKLSDFIARQPIFFTATAPEEGRVNLSPKGMDTFRVLDEATVAYLDLTGSGNETAAHLMQNRRMTVMFCSFDRNALILRLYGKGEVIGPEDSGFDKLVGLFPDYPGARQIIRLHIENVQTSCGYGVPQMELVNERPTLAKWAEKKGDKELAEYREKNNSVSIDGLPTGLKS